MFFASNCLFSEEHYCKLNASLRAEVLSRTFKLVCPIVIVGLISVYGPVLTEYEFAFVLHNDHYCTFGLFLNSYTDE